MQRRRIKRGNSRFFVFFLFLLGVALLILYLSRYLLMNFEFFNVKNIVVEGDSNLNNLEELAHGYIGQNIFKIDKENVKLKYENIVRIEDVNIDKILPNKLKIKIKEKRGAFFIKTKEGHIFPITETKTVLDMNDFYPKEDLPIINTNILYDNIVISEKIKSKLVEKVFSLHDKICSELPLMERKISEYYLKNDKIYFVEINSASHIYIGNKYIDDNIQKFKFYVENYGLPKNKIIDFRYRDHIVLKKYKSKNL